MFERCLGMFVNMLAVRVRIESNAPAATALRRVSDELLQCQRAGGVPQSKIVEAIRDTRRAPGSSLFSTAFSFHDSPRPQRFLEAFSPERIVEVLPNGSAKFDLNVIGIPTPALACDSIELCWEYDAAIFDEGTITRLSSHYQMLLEGIAADSEQAIARLPLLSEQELRQLMQWNDTAVDYPRDRCITQLFEQQVERNPAALAVVMGEQRLCYGELNARANQLAHHLRTLGVGPDVLVAIAMERSPDLVVGLLGILKAGGAYVPLDPSYPAERLAYMLADTNAPVLLTQQRLRAQFAARTATTLCVDADWATIDRQPTRNPPCTAHPHHLAYVIYTSGSTGQPKGVMIEQRSLVNYVTWLQRVFPIDHSDRVLQSTPTSFDISVLELYWPLVTGAQVELAEPDLHRSPSALVDLARRRRITIVQIVPSMLNAMVDGPGFRELVALRRVFTAGEALGVELVRRFHDQTAAELVNGYGPTETTVYSTFWRCARGDPRSVIPIGMPVANTRIHILDAFGETAPVGMVGELCIAGDGVARGYLGLPELTSERFLPDASPAGATARIYATGDLASYLPDGAIRFLGRRDHQVKLRGFRIELGEVEAALARHRGVAAGVVTVTEHSSDDRRLVAYVVAKIDPAPSADQLREFLRASLPEHMIPAAFVAMDRFPLTPSGKIDRKSLPPPGREHAAADEKAYVSPRDETERILCRVWAETLQLDRIGIDDNFFDVGGHSLLGARLFARMGEELGQSLPLGVLFERPTVRRLAEVLRTPPAQRTASSLVAITRGESPAPIFAVPGIGGNVIGFADLARWLGPEQPFYAFQAIGLDGHAEPLESIEAMANRYLAEIRSIQPHGPYVLLGACFGATVAYEMARQALAMNEGVAFLGLLEPTRRGGEEAGRHSRRAPRALRRIKGVGAFVQGRFGLYRDEMARLGARERIGYLAGKLRTAFGRIASPSSLEGVRLEINQMRVHRANVAALQRYDRKPLTGRVNALVIFETPARASNPVQIDSSNRWQLDAIRIAVAGKDSGDMLSNENARILAAPLADELRKALGHATIMTGPRASSQAGQPADITP
jgi:amino acid adenylation domain-containing protein